MTNYFVYQFGSEEESFNTGGPMSSWFYYYKWADDIETFSLQVTGFVNEGDFIWFVIDNKVIGRAYVSSVNSEFERMGHHTVWCSNPRSVNSDLLYEPKANIRNERYRKLLVLEQETHEQWSNGLESEK